MTGALPRWQLIALARAHGMNNLEVKFDHSGDRIGWSVPHRDTKTTFNWSEGRHGCQTNIYMTRTEVIRCFRDALDEIYDNYKSNTLMFSMSFPFGF